MDIKICFVKGAGSNVKTLASLKIKSRRVYMTGIDWRFTKKQKRKHAELKCIDAMWPCSKRMRIIRVVQVDSALFYVTETTCIPGVDGKALF